MFFSKNVIYKVGIKVKRRCFSI